MILYLPILFSLKSIKIYFQNIILVWGFLVWADIWARSSSLWGWIHPLCQEQATMTPQLSPDTA